MSVSTSEIPADVARRLAEFCEASKTGTLQLDIKDGRVMAWRLTEQGRVDTKKR